MKPFTTITGEVDHDAHREFLNRYYGWSKRIYDVSRKYYLFGRDRVIRELGREDWSTLVEIGPGTGRNLLQLRKAKPEATFGGVEACDEMLEFARERLPGVPLVQGFAESVDYANLLGEPIDRVLFSYCLSMIQDQAGALDRALASVRPGGQIVVVDFADLSGMPGLAGKALHKWLDLFHVESLDPAPLIERGAVVTYGPGRYYLIARIQKPLA